MKKENKEKIDIWDYYNVVEVAVQRVVLIKKALGIRVREFGEELDWVLETFQELNKEGEIECGYYIIKTYKEENKQKIDIYFRLANN